MRIETLTEATAISRLEKAGALLPLGLMQGTVNWPNRQALVCDYRREEWTEMSWQIAVYDTKEDRMIDRFNVK